MALQLLYVEDLRAQGLLIAISSGNGVSIEV
jgi:hypothetical protein